MTYTSLELHEVVTYLCLSVCVSVCVSLTKLEREGYRSIHEQTKYVSVRKTKNMCVFGCVPSGSLFSGTCFFSDPHSG